MEGAGNFLADGYFSSAIWLVGKKKRGFSNWWFGAVRRSPAAVGVMRKLKRAPGASVLSR